MKAGLKLKFILLLILLGALFTGFKNLTNSVNSPKSENYNFFSLERNSYFPDYSSYPIPQSKKGVIDTTKKSKTDSTKKLIDTLSNNKARTDSTKKLVDSLSNKNAAANIKTDKTALPDTTKKDSISADTRFLLHLRGYSPYLNLNPRYRSGFYDPFQNRVQRTIKLDSSGTQVIINETLAGQQIRPKFYLSLREYLEIRKEQTRRSMWELPLRNYQKKEEKKSAQNFLADFTKVDIPLPSVSFLSIFGPPKIQLEVNGSVKVHAGWRNEVQEGFTLALQGNTRNEPDFSQEIQIGLKGKIGDKLDINADWGTKRNFQYENILKITYTGYEDEIVKSVEAGNVAMQTSPLIGGSEALFGVKARFQIGPLKLEALASQKRSQSEEKNVSSGSQVTKYTKRAWEYSTNHYFIDSIYARNEVFNAYYGRTPQITFPDLQITEIEVWKTTTGVIDNIKEIRANAYLELEQVGPTGKYNDSYRDSLLQTVPGTIVGNQRFIKLEEITDYDYNDYTGVISFKTLINETDAIAVAYKSKSGNYGEMAANSGDVKVRVLKLIKPQNLQPSFTKAWGLQLKNIYPLGGKKIKKEGFKFYLKYQVEGNEPQDNINGQKLLNIFGFDKYDASSQPNPDGEFDYFTEVTIFPETGEIIFPYLHPFAEDLPQLLKQDPKYSYDGLYTKSQTMARLETDKDKFILTGEYSAATTSTIQIFNAVENSVKVRLDGVELTPGVDFTVEYLGPIAELVIRNPRALVPGANLNITYEQNDMINLASKTLLGLRGMIDITKDTKLGFTAMNLNQQTLSDKVTIGQEPLSNSMYGLDFSGSYELPFLTKAINSIIPTNEMSKLVVNGEFAYINPDPNTKKSTIAGDESKSIAYIDDFEGSRKTIPIGSNYGGWKDISFPRLLIDGDNRNNSDKLKYKAKVSWFNDLRQNAAVTVADLYGDERAQSVSRDDQRITAMDLWYQPSKHGYYNKKPDLSDKSKLWGGIMRSLSSTANNLIEENIQYIEFWMKITTAPANAKLYIDLGQISEDIIPNGELNTEDLNKNDAYDAGEDVGLDGLTDQDEKNDTSLEEADPSDDNYVPTALDYLKINGTEGNASNIDMGRIPDSEDLNRNWFLDRVDNFFRYEMPLDTTRNNEFIQGGKGNKGWYLVRIPLNKYNPSLTVGNPDLRITETIRVFVAGAETDVRVRLAEFNLVGNQWRKVSPKTGVSAEADEVLLVQTISKDDNSEYSSPPGLQAEIDRTKTDRTVYKNEQSLNLVINNLEPGDKREIIKDYARGLDVFNYKEMRMYVHGDELPGTTNIAFGKKKSGSMLGDSTFNGQLYFRFGIDTTNFYEYRMPVEPGWKDMKIIFSYLTSIKQSRTRIDSLYSFPVLDRPGHSYGIKGNPTLTNIKFFIVGIVNPVKEGLSNNKISGSVWINELRVLDADNSPGWSYLGSASFKLADIMMMNFNIQNKNPYFHKIGDRFGNRIDDKSWTLSTEIDFVKLLPFDLPGSNLRFTYTKSESVNKPLYLFNTDIKVSEAVTKLDQKLREAGTYTEEEIRAKLDSMNTVSYTTTVNETYSMPRIEIKLPTTNWFNRDIINGLSFGFNYNKRSEKSPNVINSNSWQWDVRSDYLLDLSRRGLNFAVSDIPILGYAVDWSSDYGGVRIHFLPQSLRFGLSARRMYKYDLSRPLTDSSTPIPPSISRDFTTTRYMEFIWNITENAFFNVTTKYNLDITSSHAYLLADTNKQSRPEKDIWRDIFSKGIFGRDFQVEQRLDIRTSPRLPSIWDLNRYFQLNLSYNVRYSWKNDFQSKEIGRSALYDATFKIGTSIRWKAFTAPLFQTSTGPVQVQSIRQNLPSETKRGRGRSQREGQADENKPEDDKIAEERAKIVPDVKDELAVNDTTAGKKPTAGGAEIESPSTLTTAWRAIRSFLKFSFFDYEKLDFNFEIQNSMGGGALKGEGFGFNNMFGLSTNFNNGPSRLFMLGLSRDLGPRANVANQNSNISDNYSQKNKIDFRTSKTLWEGAEFSINWSVDWGLNKSTTLKVEDNGDLTATNVNATGTIDRTFFTIPPVLVFSTFFNSGIKKVSELYSKEPDGNLSQAFVEGFETLPILSKIPFLKDVMKYIPRPNWSFTWTGLEKFPLFNFAKRASVSHVYTSHYKEGWKLNSNGGTEIQQQSIEYGFAPLIGLTLSFDQVLGGTLNTTVKYNTKSTFTFSAGSATKNISQALQNDLDFSASFLKTGFEIPLFGLSLKNDIEFSISFTTGRVSNILFKMDKFREEGEPVDGTIRTKISPRIKYTMSQKVNVSVYYERTTVKPEGASRTPPITTNVAGVDVEIRIGK